ncbi:hypothetical protein L218DRAFT_1009124 [Marasmius fiardii PR-910]|nr:hypothetical protein L218DRAFT_1009124 [Marasmius fiardii PR-910]
MAEIMEAAITLEQSDKSREYYHEACKRLERNRCKRSKSCSKECKNQFQTHRFGFGRDGSPSRLQIVDNRRYKVKSRSPPRDDQPINYPIRPKQREQFKLKFDRKENKPFVKLNDQKFNNFKFQSKDSPRAGETFKMMCKDGQIRLCRILDLSESEGLKAQDAIPMGGDKNSAQAIPSDPEHDNEPSEDQHSPSSYDGSQHESGDESERAGFMRDNDSILSYDGDLEDGDYTTMISSERLCGGWEDPELSHIMNRASQLRPSMRNHGKTMLTLNSMSVSELFRRGQTKDNQSFSKKSEL